MIDVTMARWQYQLSFHLQYEWICAQFAALLLICYSLCFWSFLLTCAGFCPDSYWILQHLQKSCSWQHRGELNFYITCIIFLLSAFLSPTPHPPLLLLQTSAEWSNYPLLLHTIIRLLLFSPVTGLIWTDGCSCTPTHTYKAKAAHSPALCPAISVQEFQWHKQSVWTLWCSSCY